MTSDQLLAEALAAQDRARRYGRIELIVFIAATIVIGLALLIGVPARIAQSDIKGVGEQNACIARANAAAIAGIGKALAAAPAPNPTREDAVTKIIEATRKLRDVEKMCPGP